MLNKEDDRYCDIIVDQDIWFGFDNCWFAYLTTLCQIDKQIWKSLSEWEYNEQPFLSIDELMLLTKVYSKKSNNCG